MHQKMTVVMTISIKSKSISAMIFRDHFKSSIITLHPKIVPRKWLLMLVHVNKCTAENFNRFLRDFLSQGEMVILVTDRPPSPTHICRFCTYFPLLCIFAGLYLYLVISEAYFPVFPDNQKILISFFQVPNAGGMKAAGSLHVSPNSINQTSILTTLVITRWCQVSGAKCLKSTITFI